MIQLLLISISWFGWRGYREGLLQAVISFFFMLCAIPLSMVFAPLFSSIFPVQEMGPLRGGILHLFAWILSVTTLNLVFRLMTWRWTGLRQSLKAVAEKRWIKWGGLATGVLEGFVLCVLIAGIGRISERLSSWPERYPDVMAFENPEWLESVAKLVKGPVGRGLAGMSGFFRAPIDRNLDRVEIMLELAMRGKSLEKLGKESPALRTLAERPEIASLMKDEALINMLESGQWPKVFEDPRVQELWEDPEIWKQLERGVQEVGPRPEEEAGRTGRM